MAGEIATHLLRDDHAAAVEAASWYANVFKDRYYLEVQAHDSAGQRDLNARVFGLAKELGLPVVASGVESVDQLAQLRLHGCGLAQGFLLGVPQPAEEIGPLVSGGDTADRIAAQVNAADGAVLP